MFRLSVIIGLGAVLVVLGWVFMSHMSSFNAEAQEKQRQREEFASDRNPKALQVSPAPFDGDRAMKYLRDICDIGPRISGSEGMKRQQDLLKKHFEEQGGKVEFQRFRAKQFSREKTVDMANTIVSYWPDRTKRVILCSHYDTRPLADQEPDERRWRDPFVSANDGGSGVAWLMEFAHHVRDLNINIGVDLVLFDGEEYIYDKDDKYFFGSEHFAGAYQRGRFKNRYIAAILLDMIAGKTAAFPKEPNSTLWAGALVESVWRVAAEQKCKVFLQEQGTIAVNDDHIPLNRGGIPAIDLIDFSYPHWHKLSDTPANCAPEPMVEVSKVLSVWLQRVR